MAVRQPAKSIKVLFSRHQGRIYVFIPDSKTVKSFLKNTEAEGFTFGGGVKPTERELDRIFATNRNMTINYVGFIGHMTFEGVHKIGNQPLIKINYRKFHKTHSIAIAFGYQRGRRTSNVTPKSTH